MEKLSREQIDSAYEASPSDLNQDTIELLFYLHGFRIKEYSLIQGGVDFEIHYKNTFIIGYKKIPDYEISQFYNENIDFGDGTDGISMNIESCIELIYMTMTYFMTNFGIEYNGVYIFEHTSFLPYTEEEYNSIIEYLSQKLIRYEDEKHDME